MTYVVHSFIDRAHATIARVRAPRDSGFAEWCWGKALSELDWVRRPARRQALYRELPFFTVGLLIRIERILAKFGQIRQSFGADALFLAPEYLGSVNIFGACFNSWSLMFGPPGVDLVRNRIHILNSLPNNTPAIR